MIPVICSCCGSTGKIKSLQYFSGWDWFEEACPECKGIGIVQELSFDERKELKQKEATK